VAAGAATRVAVTVVPLRLPATRTGAPTGNCAAVAGAAFVPKAVCPVITTVNARPRAFVTVQVDPFSAVIFPRTPRAAFCAGLGVGAADDAGADWPDEVAWPHPATPTATATSVATINDVRTASSSSAGVRAL
jgi:hypothetical protein